MKLILFILFYDNELITIWLNYIIIIFSIFILKYIASSNNIIIYLNILFDTRYKHRTILILLIYKYLNCVLKKTFITICLYKYKIDKYTNYTVAYTKSKILFNAINNVKFFYIILSILRFKPLVLYRSRV